MKTKELLEKQVVIDDNIILPYTVRKLEYKDNRITGNFDCAHTLITSLEGSPSWVGGSFYCYNTKIISLEGAPRMVYGNFEAHNTNILSLHNIHKQVKYIGKLLSLPTSIKSEVLGVMYIKGLKAIHLDGSGFEQNKVVAIINKHLQGNRNVHECQEELLEAGFAEYAKL